MAMAGQATPVPPGNLARAIRSAGGGRLKLRLLDRRRFSIGHVCKVDGRCTISWLACLRILYNRAIHFWICVQKLHGSWEGPRSEAIGKSMDPIDLRVPQNDCCRWIDCWL